MNLSVWRWIKELNKLLSTGQPEPVRQAERIAAMQLHVVLPAKAGVIAVVLFYIWHHGSFGEEETIRGVAVDWLRNYFVAFLVVNFIALFLFVFWRKLPSGLFPWLAFTLGLLDGLFVAGLMFITEGFESIMFWVFPGLIVLNALSIPLAVPQIVLNLLLSAFYLTAGVLNVQIPISERASVDPRAFRPLPPAHNTNAVSPAAGTNAAVPAAGTNRPSRPGDTSFVLAVGGTNAVPPADSTNRISRPRPGRSIDSPYVTAPAEISTEPLVTHLLVLWLLTACAYGVQVLEERQRRAFDEEREFAVREAHLHSTGRLAAEFAHQIKNPLAIINNAAFSVRRALKEGKRDVSRQIEIIQEEVERSDKIVTQIMGYAQLTEGRVEKLEVAEELNRAIEQVFPAAVDCAVSVERDFPRELPPLLMQRRHLSEILVNLLTNAREAMNDQGTVSVSAAHRSDDSIEISVRDNGPGVPPDRLERIFEAYYTTKEKGTGLGLAIVKHNTELYAGTVRVESGLGKGARFIVTFPAKTAVSPVKSR
jgi:signal transduction histidine kinase